MANKKTPTAVELEFMEVVWAEGEVTADDVQKALRKRGRKLADGSVRKVLGILLEKGQLTRRKEGRFFFYRAKTKPQRTKANIVRDVVDRVFRGSAPRMVASLFESRDISDDDLEQIKRLIAEHEKERE